MKLVPRENLYLVPGALVFSLEEKAVYMLDTSLYTRSDFDVYCFGGLMT